MYDDTVTVDKAYYNKLKEQTTWISVKDRLPEPSETVLICTPYGTVDVDTFQAHMRQGVFNKYNSSVTHWMPLPEPPESEG